MTGSPGYMVARRVLLLGRLNVARDYHPGIVIILAIPIGTIVFFRFILFNALLLQHVSYNYLLLCTFLTLLFSISSELMMLGLFFCDPGFTTDTNDEISHYCPVCCLYVRDFDHHCGIVGACIGGKNMGFFLFFLITVGCLMWLLVFFSGMLLWFFVKETTPEGPIINTLMVILTKEWWMSSLIKPFLAFSCALSCYGASFTSGLGVLYWVYLFRGIYSLERRRRSSLRGNVSAIFRHMCKFQLAGKVLESFTN
ncbi:Palmitoyltransferase [Trypanosoma melophagium]|uniref:Palmitoyltransferase n=1 Tax=Trypanosoma melophagium TaxID=715481 RepID=UPI003519F968|nr:Palmitoyltransferase [Trypanosoma melophagium]